MRKGEFHIVVGALLILGCRILYVFMPILYRYETEVRGFSPESAEIALVGNLTTICGTVMVASGIFFVLMGVLDLWLSDKKRLY